ncbi:hypothetical protein [Streptomyces sp. BPTC-684]|uniref:hypothetical protein n=1 Tax=Streptomyces sp. BPTC-684 TaxID=3043734 RepID=UPI0024B0AD74|nr:hypothetical protein [Streptomyces sp. BPTC-684]WHM41407.1 hypothetical protein QIY60_20215 [Streptomyces sp. BPTC-684]
MSRLTAALAAVTVLTVTASGCVTVHGEREVVPSATRAEAAQALRDFTDAYNKADKAFDPALDAGRVTGPLGAVNQAGLKARHVTDPGGNPQHVPLELTDAKFSIPRKAGWPRWFVADTDSNRDRDSGPDDTRWLLVFVRGGVGDVWKAAHLSVLAPKDVPSFAADKDGFAEPVRPDDTGLAVAPKDLSEQYVSYLRTGRPEAFAPGPHTTLWREQRKKNAVLPGLSTQYVDQPLDGGDFAPLALRTRDGGALVFFGTRHFERQTAAKGVRLNINADVRALMTGEARSTVTKERVSDDAALVPSTGRGPITVINRLQGLVSAKGE